MKNGEMRPMQRICLPRVEDGAEEEAEGEQEADQEKVKSLSQNLDPTKRQKKTKVARESRELRLAHQSRQIQTRRLMTKNKKKVKVGRRKERTHLMSKTVVGMNAELKVGRGKERVHRMTKTVQVGVKAQVKVQVSMATWGRGRLRHLRCKLSVASAPLKRERNGRKGRTHHLKAVRPR